MKNLYNLITVRKQENDNEEVVAALYKHASQEVFEKALSNFNISENEMMIKLKADTALFVYEREIFYDDKVNIEIIKSIFYVEDDDVEGMATAIEELSEIKFGF